MKQMDPLMPNVTKLVQAKSVAIIFFLDFISRPNSTELNFWCFIFCFALHFPQEKNTHWMI